MHNVAYCRAWGSNAHPNWVHVYGLFTCRQLEWQCFLFIYLQKIAQKNRVGEVRSVMAKENSQVLNDFPHCNNITTSSWRKIVMECQSLHWMHFGQIQLDFVANTRPHCMQSKWRTECVATILHTETSSACIIMQYCCIYQQHLWWYLHTHSNSLTRYVKL